VRNNFILIFLALLSVALLFYVKSADHKPRNIHVETKPQEYMADFFVTLFTEDGLVKNKLSGDYWAYQPETNGSTLKRPHLIVYKPDGSVWIIDAKQAFVKQPNIGTLDDIVLHNNVVIHRPATGTFVPITLETNALLYQPSKSYAESDELVTLTKPDLKVSGIGMRAFLDKDSVELLHNVKAAYTLKTGTIAP
jgi:LPS export ABC transporter protein LptC